jgi:hypothetical protein
MGICWYCYWGWAKPVADIYDEALAKLGGDDSALKFGRSHIVWEDENWEDENIDFCLNEADRGRFTEEEDAIVIESLRKLRALPEEVRCCEPEDYDDEHPSDYPPTVEVVKR